MLSGNYQSSLVNLIKWQDITLIHRNLLHFYTLTTKNKKEKLNNPIYHYIKKNKEYLKINLPKQGKGLKFKNQKILIKKFKDDINKQKDKPCYWTGRINIVKIPPQSTDSTQSLPNHQWKIKNKRLIILWKYKRPQIAKAILREKQSWRYKLP